MFLDKYLCKNKKASITLDKFKGFVSMPIAFNSYICKALKQNQVKNIVFSAIIK